MRIRLITHIFILIIALALLSTKSYTQNCLNFHKTFCISYAKDGYKPILESRSFQLAKGEYATQEVTFHNGHDYHINVAVDDVFGNQLFVQVMDIDNQEIIYDNTKDNMNLNLEFSALETINAQITLETPSSSSESTYEIKGCLGLLIETRPTPPTGFLK